MVSQECARLGAGPDETGLEALVKALQEEGFVMRAELAEWKRKTGIAAEENVILKEELESQITKLKTEVEGWRDRAAMSAGKGIVARRQLEDFGKQVKSLNVELQKWKDLVAEREAESANVRKENESLKADRDQWVQTAGAASKEVESLKVETNCCIKSLEADLEKWKQIATTKGSSDQPQGSEPTSSEDGPSELEISLQGEVEALKKKAASAELETTSLQAKVEDFKKKAASAELESTSLQSEVKDLKQKVVSAELETTSLQGEIEELRKKVVSAELDTTSLQGEIEELRKVVVAGEKEQEQLRKHYEARVTELQVEVGAWKKRAACIAEDGKHERLDLENRLKEALLKVRDATEFVTFERKRSAQEVAEVQAEMNDWKVIAADASEECSSLRIAFDTVVKELQAELALAKENAETVSKEGNSLKTELEVRNLANSELEAQILIWKVKAEEGESVKAELEKVVKNLKEQILIWNVKAEGVAKNQEHSNNVIKGLELQLKDGKSVNSELEKQVVIWKEKAEGALQGVAQNQEHTNNVIKGLELELVQWKKKAEEGESVKSELEKVVEDLEEQILIWKEKAEGALQGLAKNQEYAELVETLDSELCIWRQRTQEGKLLQLHLEKEQVQLVDSLTGTQTELQRWRDRAAAAVAKWSYGNEQEEEEDGVMKWPCGEENGGGGGEDEDDDNPLSVLEFELQKWKLKAEEGEVLQLELKNVQKELGEWKQKAAAVTLATESLKEELDCVIEEGKLEKEDLYTSITELETALFMRSQEVMSAQAEVKEWKEKMKVTQAELKEWKDKAVAITLTTKSLMEELDFRIEEGLQEKQEFCNSVGALKESVLGWKEKAAENESMVVELNTSLMETQKALREWKDRASSVAVATESLRSEMDCMLEDHRLEKEELCNTINDLEAEVYEWKARAQDGITVQRQLERALSELERKKRPLLRAHKSGSGSY